MPRKDDLEDSIRESYRIINEYEAIIRTSDRPEEKARARRVIKEQWGLVEDYFADYAVLVEDAFPIDIAEIAARFGSRLAGLRPIDVVRQATKLLTEPVARALTGEAWKALKQRLLTQASKLPAGNYLDVGRMNASAAEIYRLSGEVKTILATYRIDPDPGVIRVLARRAGMLAGHLIAIYCLEQGEGGELAWLVEEVPG
jgi:hypothetical protein